MSIVERRDVLIIGGGIVGLATAFQILRRLPNSRVAILERENRLAMHQTGRAFGVMRSGGLAGGAKQREEVIRGRRLLQAFCAKEGIPTRKWGELVIAEREEDRRRLEALQEEAGSDGVGSEWLEGPDLERREPHLRAVAGLWFPEGGAVDYVEVCERLAKRIFEMGGEFFGNTTVEAVVRGEGEVRVETSRGEFCGKVALNCAGLHRDQLIVAGRDGKGLGTLPLRWDSYQLEAEAEELVQHHVAVLPEQGRRFSGLELNRTVQGEVFVRHYSSLAMGRDAYGRWELDANEVLEMAGRSEVRKLAGLHWEVELPAAWRSVSRKALVARVREVLPGIEPFELEPVASGILAVPLERSGAIPPETVITVENRYVEVCAAPDTGATAAFRIAERVRDSVVRWLTEAAAPARLRAM